MSFSNLRIGLFLAFSCWMCGLALAQDVSKIDDPTIEGKWIAKENSKNGPIKIVKEHGQGKTTVTAYDAANQVLYAKISEYQTERHGNVKVLVFKNGKFTAGPDAGKTDNRTRSYVYRVVGKKFYEVRGMVIGVDEPVAVVVWEQDPSPET